MSGEQRKDQEADWQSQVERTGRTRLSGLGGPTNWRSQVERKRKEPLNNVIPDSIRNPKGPTLDSGFRRNDGFAGRMMTYSEAP